MSRSSRKNSIIGNAQTPSEKEDKSLCNRKLRKKNKLKLKKGEEIFLEKEEVLSVWEMEKDGKSFFDKEKYPELMRK